MPTLQVRDMPAPLYQRLAETARREHRSLAQQTVAILSRELGPDAEPSARRRASIRELRQNPIPRIGKKKIPDPARWIRQDRER